jgi:hypothetical protein
MLFEIFSFMLLHDSFASSNNHYQAINLLFFHI